MKLTLDAQAYLDRIQTDAYRDSLDGKPFLHDLEPDVRMQVPWLDTAQKAFKELTPDIFNQSEYSYLESPERVVIEATSGMLQSSEEILKKFRDPDDKKLLREALIGTQRVLSDRYDRLKNGLDLPLPAHDIPEKAPTSDISTSGYPPYVPDPTANDRITMASSPEDIARIMGPEKPAWADSGKDTGEPPAHAEKVKPSGKEGYAGRAPGKGNGIPPKPSGPPGINPA